MRINAERLHENLRQLAGSGRPRRGVTRLALSPRIGRTRSPLPLDGGGWAARPRRRLRQYHRAPRRGGERRRGGDGLHIDTVRRGGRYDGAYGVLAALEVMRTLSDTGVTTRLPLELVNWTNEEEFASSRPCSPPAP